MRSLRRREDASIPTSSMADIAFLLIIFFMVTTVFSATKGIELKFPDTEEPDPEPESAVFIEVRPEEVLVDCRPTPVAEILAYLEPKLARNPNKPVILYTVPEAEYQDMITVYDLLAEHRLVMNLSIPTKTDIDEYIRMFGANPLESWCDR